MLGNPMRVSFPGTRNPAWVSFPGTHNNLLQNERKSVSSHTNVLKNMEKQNFQEGPRVLRTNPGAGSRFLRRKPETDTPNRES